MFKCLVGWVRMVLAMRVRATGARACWRSMLLARNRVDCMVCVTVSLERRVCGCRFRSGGVSQARAAVCDPARTSSSAKTWTKPGREVRCYTSVQHHTLLPPIPPLRLSRKPTPSQFPDQYRNHVRRRGEQNTLEVQRAGTMPTSSEQERVTMPFKFVTGMSSTPTLHI